MLGLDYEISVIIFWVLNRAPNMFNPELQEFKFCNYTLS